MNLLMNYAMTAMSGSNLLSSVASFFASHKLLANLLILLDYTSFLTSGVSALKVVIIAVGGGLAVLGVVNLLEGYGNDNPGAKSQGIRPPIMAEIKRIRLVIWHVSLWRSLINVGCRKQRLIRFRLIRSIRTDCAGLEITFIPGWCSFMISTTSLHRMMKSSTSLESIVSS